MNPFSFGAHPSPQDVRTVHHTYTLAGLFEKGGVDYLPGDIENQAKEGICTAISLVQSADKQHA